MDVFEAVNSRIACRAFLDKPVDLDHRQGSDRAGARAASGGNLQSWNVYALDRQTARRVQGDRRRSASPGKIRATARPSIRSIPSRCSAPTRSAARSTACSFTARSASTATDPAARLAQYKKNFEFFDAPVALFITIDRRLGPGQWADLGGYIHTLAFLARGYGLDTCPQEAWARLYDTVGEFLKLPPNEMLFCGWRSATATASTRPTTSARRARSCSEFCKFYGFD